MTDEKTGAPAKSDAPKARKSDSPIPRTENGHPFSFGTMGVPAELDVLSDREQDLVHLGHSIDGAQQTVRDEGGEPTQVHKELFERGQNSR